MHIIITGKGNAYFIKEICNSFGSKVFDKMKGVQFLEEKEKHRNRKVKSV